MRLFAEERQVGTIEALMTAPVSEAEVVLGKYAGALTFALAVSLPALSSLFILAYLSPGLSVRQLDGGAIAGGVLILVLMAAACTAVGLLASLLTRNQIVAAVTCFAAILFPLVVGQMLALTSLMPVGLAAYVSADGHVLSFARGSIDTRPVVLYLSLTALLLFISVRVLESRRWR
jgi:ABC-2 type transport system permease protein